MIDLLLSLLFNFSDPSLQNATLNEGEEFNSQEDVEDEAPPVEEQNELLFVSLSGYIAF